MTGVNEERYNMLNARLVHSIFFLFFFFFIFLLPLFLLMADNWLLDTLRTTTFESCRKTDRPVNRFMSLNTTCLCSAVLDSARWSRSSRAVMRSKTTSTFPTACELFCPSLYYIFLYLIQSLYYVITRLEYFFFLS